MRVSAASPLPLSLISFCDGDCVLVAKKPIIASIVVTATADSNIHKDLTK